LSPHLRALPCPPVKQPLCISVLLSKPLRNSFLTCDASASLEVLQQVDLAPILNSEFLLVRPEVFSYKPLHAHQKQQHEEHRLEIDHRVKRLICMDDTPGFHLPDLAGHLV
jgi:hypothetical protein